MQSLEQTDASRNDIQLMTDVLHRYCRSMDRIDRPLGYSVWDGDGLADYGDLFQGTGRAFIDWACDFHASLVSTSHQVANITIRTMGQRAGSEAYVSVDLLGRSEEGYVLTSGRGRYLDEWINRDGRWGIATRRFIMDFAVSQPTMAPMIGIDSRSRSDPSFALLGDAPETVSNG